MSLSTPPVQDRAANAVQSNHRIARLARTLLHALLFLGTAALAGVLNQMDSGAFSRAAFAFPVLTGLHAGLAWLGDLLLAPFPISFRRRCRLAFLISLGIGLAWQGAAWTGLIAAPRSIGGSILALAGALIGALLGSLAITARLGGLWENNAPPSEAVARQVQQIHADRLRDLQETPLAKTFFDRALAALGLLLSLPFWLAAVILIWIEDPGPLFFVKNSVGRNGVNFRQYKFRTMVREAEKETGPVLSYEDDQRTLIIGRVLRKTALDELPQLINILRGEMSFVGPRPQRTVLVFDYLKMMPEYADRHAVAPGLAGLAQVAGDYYLTPRQKLRFDRLYIRRMTLGFDLKLLGLAFLVAFWFRWKRQWNGRIPRRLMRWDPLRITSSATVDPFQCGAAPATSYIRGSRRPRLH